MKRVKTALALLSGWALLMGTAIGVVSAQEIFTSQLMAPNGISVDRFDTSGNVNVHSDGVATTLLTKFDPNGNQINQVTLGNGSIDAQRFENSRLASDPLLDRLYLLSPEGDIVVFVSSTFQEIGRFNIQQDLTVNTSSVYDVATQGPSNAFVLAPGTTYGDIAVFRSMTGAAPAWLITGFSDGIAFVMRIPLQNMPDDVTQAAVILMSSIDSRFPLDRPRGIAAGAEDDVGLTTLPAPTSIPGCPDQVIRFSLTATVLNAGNVMSLPGSSGVPSWGMDANATGFMLTTGGPGIADCLQGGGRVVFISNDLSGIDPNHIIPLDTFPGGQPADVAIAENPTGLIYMTVPDFNEVGRFPASILALSTP